MHLSGPERVATPFSAGLFRPQHLAGFRRRTRIDPLPPPEPVQAQARISVPDSVRDARLGGEILASHVPDVLNQETPQTPIRSRVSDADRRGLRNLLRQGPSC